jgi:hypothetical protein
MKILFVHPGGNISDNPSLRSIISSCLESSFNITVWRRGSWSSDNYISGIRYVEDVRPWWYLKTLFANRVCSSTVKKLIGYIEKKRWSKSKFDLVISIDRHGIIEANMIISGGSRHIHLSYEIFFESETNARFKKLERPCYERVELLVIQDKKRAEIFAKENGISLKEFFLPVSGGKSSFQSFQGRNLGHHILALGSLAEWTMIPELIDCAIQKKFSLPVLLHGRYGAMPEKIVRRIRGNKDVEISSRYFVSERDFYEFVSQAYIGYAMYQSIKGNKYLGKNIEDLGLSSGKISTFLSCGVPIITNITGEFAMLIREFGAGVVVSEASEIPEAVARISKARDRYSRGANALFEQKLSFDLYRKELMLTISGASSV